MSTKKKEKKEKKDKDKVKIKLKSKKSKSKLLEPARTTSETGPKVSYAKIVLPPRPRSTSIGVQRLRKSTDPDSLAETPPPETSSASSEGKSPDVLRKAVAELAELENLIDDEIEFGPMSGTSNQSMQLNAPIDDYDDEFAFDPSLDFEKNIDFLTQLTEDMAAILPEDVEKAFEEVITALQSKGSDDLLGLTDEGINNMNTLDYDQFIDSIISSTQNIDMDDDDFKFDMKIEGLDEYRWHQSNELERALREIETKQNEGTPIVAAESTLEATAHVGANDSVNTGPVDDAQSPNKSPRPWPSITPHVLTPGVETPHEELMGDKPSTPRVITPRPDLSPQKSTQPEVTTPLSPRKDTVEVQAISVTALPRSPRGVISPRTVNPAEGGVSPREAAPIEKSPTPRGPDVQVNKIATPRSAVATPRAVEPTEDQPRSPQVEETPVQSDRPRGEETRVQTPRVNETSVQADRPQTPRVDETQPDRPQTPRVDQSADNDSTSSSCSDSDTSDSDSSAEETPSVAAPPRSRSGTATKVPSIPNVEKLPEDTPEIVSTSRRSSASAKSSRRGSQLTAVDRQKIINARREATLKMAQQLRDELKSGAQDPASKRQRLAQLLSEFKGVQVKGLISVFEEKMKDVKAK